MFKLLLLLLCLFSISCNTGIYNHQNCSLKMERKSFNFVEQTNREVIDKKNPIFYNINSSFVSDIIDSNSLKKKNKNINIRIFNKKTKYKLYDINVRVYLNKMSNSNIWYISNISYQYEYCRNIKKCNAKIVYGGLKDNNESYFAIGLDFYNIASNKYDNMFWSTIIELHSYNINNYFEFYFVASNKFIQDKKFIRDLFCVGEDYEIKIESDAKIVYE